MSTQLATINNNAIATYSNEGMEGFDSDAPIKPSEYILVQRTSQGENATPGVLKDRLTGEEYKEVTAIPIRVYSGRIMFPPGFDYNSKPLCRSLDGKVPVQGQGLVPQSPTCATCDFGKKMWEKGQPPACKETMRWLCINTDNGLPFYLTAKGRSMKPSKTLLETLRRYAFVSKHKGEPRNLYDYAFTIKSKFTQDAKGSYYVLDFADITKVAQIGKYAQLYHSLTSRQQQDEVEETQTETEAAIDAAAEEAVEL